MAYNNIINWLIKKTAHIETNELKSTILSFLFVFILMASYFIMRPVRDAMASDWSDSEVSMLWTINLFISIALVAIYGFIVSNVKFKHVVPGVYTFFALSFICFFLGANLVPDRTLVDMSFYVWVSFFALFHLSVFWSYMSDCRGQCWCFGRTQYPDIVRWYFRH
jgi:AAA family ATP:ADP antiporter